MSRADVDIYQFGEFRVDAGRRILLVNGSRAPLTPKVFDTLLVMVRRRGELLEKDELIRAIWPNSVVEENNLSQNVASLRRVLRERRGENRYIATVPGRGYRFVADVEIVDDVPGDRALRATLAVLPFANLSGDPGREYLADGLTDETITALGQVDPDRLVVIGRTSVMTYRGTTKSAADIGRELNAAYLVEGSIRAEGRRFRVTAKLIRARDQVQVWSTAVDGEPRSILEFQRELAGVIAHQIRFRLSPDRLAALTHRQTQNAEAYDQYLRGRHYWHQLTPESTRRAMDHYERATQFDADYALAWSGIADAWCAGPISGDAPPLAALAHARQGVAQALRAQPDLAETQASLGFLKFWLEWDWPAAEMAFRRAIELDSSYSLPHRMLGLLYSHVSRHREAAAAMRRVREIDPLLAVHHALSAQVAFAGRDFELAEQFARQAIVVDPEFWIGHFQLAQARVELGDHEGAFSALTHAGRACGGNSKVPSLRGYLFAKLGRTTEAGETLDTLMAIARSRFIPPYAVALVHLGLGDFDRAVEWLGRAYDAHDVHLAFLPIDAKWDPCRGDERFVSLLGRCGFAVD